MPILPISRFPPRFELVNLGVGEMAGGEPGPGEGEETGGGAGASTAAAVPSRDIRRCKCEFCDVVRSKKSLIRAHVLEHHEDEVDGLEDYQEGGGSGAARKDASHGCKECGMRFKKPAHLKQHRQSHSLESISSGMDV